MSVQRSEIIAAIAERLNVESFKDYCPNGLQVEGCSTISKIVTGVTASQRTIDAAIAQQADLLLVHHGFFWKGEAPVIVGMKQRRIKALLESGLNLAAYHLPLDAHPSLGNNAQLGLRLGVNIQQQQYLQPSEPTLGLMATLEQAMTGAQLCQRLAAVVGRSVTHVPVTKSITKIAWCTGAAQGFIDAAADQGVDAYISGEISEPTAHIARERDLHYFAAGHHATERYGVQALGEWLATEFDLSHSFYDDDNPA